MRKAGLNPILSAMKGAPSIGGSAAAVSPATAAQDASSLVSSASQANQQKLNNQKLKAEIDVLNSQKVKNLADASKSGNIANISKNVSNLSEGFYGLTDSTSKSISKNIEDMKNLPDIIKDAIKYNDKKGNYDWFKKLKGK